MVATEPRFIISSLSFLLLCLLLFLLNVCLMCKHNILPMCLTCPEGRVSKKRKQHRHFHDLFSRQMRERSGELNKKPLVRSTGIQIAAYGLHDTSRQCIRISRIRSHSTITASEDITITDHWPVRCLFHTRVRAARH